MKNLLIIGGVAAGATAAARARRLDNDVQITILEAGADVSFANCGLPYYIGGEIEYRSSLLLSSPQTFLDQYRVNVRTNTEAIAIARERRVVRARSTVTGEELDFPYDALILAQGGKPVIPQIPGADRPHVFSLWTLEDMDRIDAYLSEREPSRAVVVGGGFIGLEMVEALARRGLEVTVVEMAPHVMPNLDPEIAGLLQKELADYGVQTRVGRSVTQIDEGSVTLSDGARLEAEMVLLSVGVRPTLELAREAGLTIGGAGGVEVSAALQTNDRRIFAAGDMVEIEHRVGGRAVRIPLAGPANRQGRIAAENALAAIGSPDAAGAAGPREHPGLREYRGALGTSIVKLFDAAAGSTGVSLAAAREAGIEADAVVVHKASHTAYYPGSQKVSLMLVFERDSGRVLGAQAAGRVGVDKRLDVVATAIAGGLTIADLAELDLAYAPPFNSPNGPVNMAAFTAENQKSGLSPAVLASEIETFVIDHEPIVLDLRDPISFGRAHLDGSTNITQNLLRDNLDRIDREETILLISEDGQKGHVALRMLAGAGFVSVYNLSGGYISMERHARASGYRRLRVGLFPVEQKSPIEPHGAAAETEATDGRSAEPAIAKHDGPLVVDVRTPMEFEMGAYPGSININLDELADRVSELGDHEREIVVYCASGARSAYAKRMLEQLGYQNVRNAGGLHDIMSVGV